MSFSQLAENTVYKQPYYSSKTTLCSWFGTSSTASCRVASINKIMGPSDPHAAICISISRTPDGLPVCSTLTRTVRQPHVHATEHWPITHRKGRGPPISTRKQGWSVWPTPAATATATPPTCPVHQQQLTVTPPVTPRTTSAAAASVTMLCSACQAGPAAHSVPCSMQWYTLKL